MNNFISLNIRYLCDKNKLTQKEFGEIFELKQNVISSYIKENATPKVETLQSICKHFEISLDDFINRDLRALSKPEPGHYYKEPAKSGMETAMPNNLIEDYRRMLDDKDKIIKMLEAENKRLRGEDSAGKTA